MEKYLHELIIVILNNTSLSSSHFQFALLFPKSLMKKVFCLWIMMSTFQEAISTKSNKALVKAIN